MATFGAPGFFCAFREQLSRAIKRECALFAEKRLPSPKESLPFLITAQAHGRPATEHRLQRGFGQLERSFGQLEQSL
jgi:hypothetical protein